MPLIMVRRIACLLDTNSVETVQKLRRLPKKGKIADSRHLLAFAQPTSANQNAGTDFRIPSEIRNGYLPALSPFAGPICPQHAILNEETSRTKSRWHAACNDAGRDFIRSVQTDTTS